MALLGSLRDQSFVTVLSGLIPARIRHYRPSIVFCAAAFTLGAALFLGGGTHGGFLSDAILELLAIPALLAALTSLVELPVWRSKTRTDVHWVLAFCFAIALVPLLQLVPLPPWIWTSLPGRGEITQIFDLIGGPTPWMPISVSPHATWLSFLSLLPPMAIFLSVIQLGYRERRALTLIIIVIGIVSVFIGLAQVTGGEGSPLRFYAITNPTEAVGFFANRNHFAALLYTVLLFTAAWAIDIGFETGSWTDVRSFEAAKIMAVTAIFLGFIVIIAGEAMARSRAGLGFTIAALLAAFVLAFTDRRNASGAKPSKLLLAAMVLAIVLSLQFALYRILGRFATDPLENARSVFAHNTIAAAKSFLPFGSGMGTFVPVYAMFEKPIDVMANTFVNHAHDDMLELCLETGFTGVILICLFLVWFGVSSFKLWRRPRADMSAFDCTLARAATMVIGLLLAHSFVDYPMRTEAIMATLAVSCALLIEPLRGGEAAVPAKRPAAASRKTPFSAALAASLGPAAVVPAGPGREVTDSGPRRDVGRWGDEIEWPAEWRYSGEQRRPGLDNPKSDPNEGLEPSPKSSGEDDKI
jgi:hypothetical protein